MTGPAGRGARLYAAAAAAADRYRDHAHVDILAVPWAERAAHIEQSTQLAREATAAAAPLYAYFASDEPTAEERAAWLLADPARWHRTSWTQP
jgi:hypothetical protein